MMLKAKLTLTLLFQVESEGEFLVEPLSILERRELMLRKWAITQVKVQWQHIGPDEATWEDEQLLKEAYPKLFEARKHRDDVWFQGGRCIAPRKTINIFIYHYKKTNWIILLFSIWINNIVNFWS